MTAPEAWPILKARTISVSRRGVVQMTKEETRTLWGSLAIAVGVFLPWHSFNYGYPIPGVFPDVGQGVITGFHLPAGQMVFATALLIAVLTLWPHREAVHGRVLTARLFASYLVLSLLLVSGLGPTLFVWNVSPHIGLAAVFLGFLLTFSAYRREMKAEDRENL